MATSPLPAALRFGAQGSVWPHHDPQLSQDLPRPSVAALLTTTVTHTLLLPVTVTPSCYSVTSEPASPASCDRCPVGHPMQCSGLTPGGPRPMQGVLPAFPLLHHVRSEFLQHQLVTSFWVVPSLSPGGHCSPTAPCGHTATRSLGPRLPPSAARPRASLGSCCPSALCRPGRVLS